MNLANLIRFKWRNSLQIIVVSLLVALLSGLFFFLFRSGNNINATVFVNIGAKKTAASGDNSTALDLVQASDQFTETIQGWFKNPEFTGKIGASLNIEPSISARRQEKQNLLLTFGAGDEATAKRLTQNVQEMLLAEIGNYNRNTGAGFQVALFSVDYKPSSSLIIYLVVLLGFILGAGMGMGICYIFELATGKIIYDFQAEQILAKKALEILPARLRKKEPLYFLTAIIDKSHGRNYHLIGIGHFPSLLQEKLSELVPGKKFTAYQFPAQTREILEQAGAESFIVCRLGKSAGADLQKIKAVMPDTFGLIIQE